MKIISSAVISGVCLLGLVSTAQAQQVYGKVGILGAGAGYAHAVNPQLGVRADFTTLGVYKRDGSSSDFDYKGKLYNDVGTAYLDYFPFKNGFRLSAGLGLRNTKVNANARPNANGTINIGDAKDIPFDPDDSAKAQAKFPSVAPYLGLGWGHNVGPERRAGWGFIADAGVYFGKPSVSLNVSQGVRDNLTLAGFDPDEQIRIQKKDFEDDAKKLRLFPAIYLGVSYTF